MNIWLYLSAVIMLITLLFTITRQFHMLQLNSYFNKRFLEYLVSATATNTIIAIGIFCVSIPLIFLNPFLFFLLCIGSGIIRIYAAINHVKKSKKRIVFTARIKRMYITAVLLSLVSLILCGLLGANDLYLRLFSFAVSGVLLLSPFVSI